MKNYHQPRPEFISHLEWQIRTAVQRRDRFAAPVRQNHWPKMRSAALILVSVLCGAAGVLATEEIQDIKTREMLLAQVEGQIRIVELQMQLVRTHLAEIQEQHQDQLVGEEAVLAATIKCREVEAEFARLRLDQEEIRISGKEPQNAISAPLIGGRDFVTERLRLQLSVAQEHASVIEKRLARLRALEDSGLINTAEVEKVMAEFMEASNRAEYFRYMIRARQRFIKGELTGEEVEREVELSEARNQLESKRLLFETARNRFSRIKSLLESGAVNESELMRSQLELLEREVELQLLQMRLQQIISEMNKRPPPER